MMPLLKKIFISVIAACFMLGGINHTTDIIGGGPLPYTFAPLGFNIFWASLAVIDFLVVILLVVKFRSGLALAAIVMVFDIALNTYAIYGAGVKLAFWPVQLQTLFCGFVLGSFPVLWGEAPRSKAIAGREASA